MYCPGQSKDLGMPLEGETWGLEVEPLPPPPAIQSAVPWDLSDMHT